MIKSASKALSLSIAIFATFLVFALQVTFAQGNPTFKIGVLDNDLEKAINRALRVRRSDCAAYARHFSWDACADQFLTALATIGPLRRIREAAYPSPAASGFRAPA